MIQRLQEKLEPFPHSNSVSGQLEILFESSINIDVNVGDRIRAGGEYPVADVMLEASRIVEPATLSLDSEYFYYDRDNNSQSDTVMVGYSVNSNAFAEVLDVEIEVFDDADVLIDSQSIVVTAGGGIGFLRFYLVYELPRMTFIPFN